MPRRAVRELQPLEQRDVALAALGEVVRDAAADDAAADDDDAALCGYSCAEISLKTLAQDAPRP
jgi:hypothetical protein